MISYNETEFIILGGTKKNALCDVSIHSTASESPDDIMQPRTIIENNAAGHTKFDTEGN